MLIVLIVKLPIEKWNIMGGPKKSSNVVYLIITVLISLSLGAYLSISLFNNFNHTTEASAIAYKDHTISRSTDGDGVTSTTYHSYINYTDRNGESHSVELEDGNNYLDEGQRSTIFYDEGSCNNVSFNEYDYGTIVGKIIVVIVLILTAVVFGRLLTRRIKQ